MARLKNDALRHDFPDGLSQPALRALSSAGYTSLDQLTKVKEADLKKLHGMGPKGIDLLRAALKTKGRSFAGPD
jgi:hypothetical protein